MRIKKEIGRPQTDETENSALRAPPEGDEGGVMQVSSASVKLSKLFFGASGFANLSCWSLVMRGLLPQTPRGSWPGLEEVSGRERVMDLVERERVLPWLNAPMIRTSSVGRELDLNRIEPTNTEEPQRTGGIRCVVSSACSPKKNPLMDANLYQKAAQTHFLQLHLLAECVSGFEEVESDAILGFGIKDEGSVPTLSTTTSWSASLGSRRKDVTWVEVDEFSTSSVNTL